MYTYEYVKEPLGLVLHVPHGPQRVGTLRNELYPTRVRVTTFWHNTYDLTRDLLIHRMKDLPILGSRIGKAYQTTGQIDR